MKYPTLPELGTSRQMIDTFLGYNHNLRINDGEFYDMTNMTSDNFPVLSPRKPRGLYTTTDDCCTGIIAKDKLCYVDGPNIVIGDDKIDMSLTPGEKNLVSMGAYIIIFPDKKYINTQDYEDRGSIEKKFEAAGVKFELCLPNGGDVAGFFYHSSVPMNFTQEAAAEVGGVARLDSSVSPPIVRKYSPDCESWTEITVAVRITATGIGGTFGEGDSIIMRGFTGAILTDKESCLTVLKAAANYIVVSGLVSQISELLAIRTPEYIDGDTVIHNIEPISESGTMSFSLEIPNMDFVIESGNRLWGCRYGTDIVGNMVNEIYASKLGDFRNWNDFRGISTDSYAASLGTDGAFTGAVNYLGNPIFFKENCLHKVYGKMPSQYQIQDVLCRGVQSGSHKSLAVLNEVVYYKSRHGVCVYDGSLPVEISEELGDVPYFNAVAGAHGNKYYISMSDSDGEYHLFVYDTAKRMWHREDNVQVRQFCSHKNELYFVTGNDCNQIKTVFGSGDKENDNTRWSVETGIIGLESPDKKYISRLNIRMKLERNSTAHFYVQYDSEDEWEHVASMNGHRLKSISVPIRPRRCDHFRIKITGEGDSKIYSICKTFEEGSDI